MGGEISEVIVELGDELRERINRLTGLSNKENLIKTQVPESIFKILRKHYPDKTDQEIVLECALWHTKVLEEN